MNNKDLLAGIRTAAEKAGQYLISSVHSVGRKDIQTKGLNDFVSFVDRNSEAMLIEDLSALLPGSSFLAEESGEMTRDSEWTWIVDPLDGTTNFIHGIPLFSVSIGLMKNKELFAGVVFEPNLGEMFYALKGEGAYLNGNRISVTPTAAMKDSLWATGFPYHDFDKIDEYMQFIRYSIKHTHGLRRLGSAAVDLAYTACGRMDGFFEFGLNPWDVAAGALLVTEAGGVVTDFSAGSNFIHNKEIIACNQTIYREFCENFRKIYFGTK